MSVVENQSQNLSPCCQAVVDWVLEMAAAVVLELEAWDYQLDEAGERGRWQGIPRCQCHDYHVSTPSTSAAGAQMGQMEWPGILAGSAARHDLARTSIECRLIVKGNDWEED